MVRRHHDYSGVGLITFKGVGIRIGWGVWIPSLLGSSLSDILLNDYIDCSAE